MRNERAIVGCGKEDRTIQEGTGSGDGRGWGTRSGRKGREASLKEESNGSRIWVGKIKRDSGRRGKIGAVGRDFGGVRRKGDEYEESRKSRCAREGERGEAVGNWEKEGGRGEGYGARRGTTGMGRAGSARSRVKGQRTDGDSEMVVAIRRRS